MPSNHLILCGPLLLLPSIFPSIRVFFNELVLLIRGPKYWSFSFSISPSSEYSGLISFKIDWFDLPAVQETLKSLFQHHSSKASVLWCSAFFMGPRADEQFGRKDGAGEKRWIWIPTFNDDQLRAGAPVLLHLPSQRLQGGPSGIITHEVTSSSTVGTRGRKGQGGRTLAKGESRNSCFPFVQCV